jgi:hypothetical protein
MEVTGSTRIGGGMKAKSTRRMNLPKRQFIGPSRTLNKQVIKLLERQVKNIFK